MTNNEHILKMIEKLVDERNDEQEEIALKIVREFFLKPSEEQQTMMRSIMRGHLANMRASIETAMEDDHYLPFLLLSMGISGIQVKIQGTNKFSVQESLAVTYQAMNLMFFEFARVQLENT